MQQRRLRLGDILDDYCPRERRITNHAVVAKIDDDVRQTRCLTCDTEHEYRQGKAPTLRKKKDPVSAAYSEVLAEVSKGTPGGTPLEADAGLERPEHEVTQLSLTDPVSTVSDEVIEPAPPRAAASRPAPSKPASESPRPEPPALEELEAGVEADEGHERAAEVAAGGEGQEVRVHRRLIRATLPRTDNQPVARPIPQFTMRQPTGRPAKFRPAPGRGPRAAAGARAGAGGAGRGGFPSRGGAPQHVGRPARADQRTRGGQPPRHGKKHSK